jgi:hypothetical protein
VLNRKRSAVEPVSVSVDRYSRGRQNERCLLYRRADLAEGHSWSTLPDADLQSLSCTLDELFAQCIYCRQGKSPRRVPMHPDGNRVVVIFLFGKRRVNGHVDIDEVAFLQWPAMARRIKLRLDHQGRCMVRQEGPTYSSGIPSGSIYHVSAR